LGAIGPIGLGPVLCMT